MNKNHTNEPNYTKLVMPRQLVLPLDYGILIKETIAPLSLTRKKGEFMILQTLYNGYI